MPVEQLAERVGATPFFAYDRTLLTRRVEVFRKTLPESIDLSYAVKANPMPAVVQHIAGLTDSLDVASALEMRTALELPDAVEPHQFRRSRQNGEGDPSSRRRRSHDRNGIDQPNCSGSCRREQPGHPAACRHPGESRLQRQGVGHADGWRTPAIRGRRREGAGHARQNRDRGCRVPRFSRLRGIPEPPSRDRGRGPAQDSRPGTVIGRAPPHRCNT